VKSSQLKHLQVLSCAILKALKRIGLPELLLLMTTYWAGSPCLKQEVFYD